MKKIDQIWNELELDNSLRNGFLLRRFSNVFLPNVFVSLQFPELYRCIVANVNDHNITVLPDVTSLRDISVEIVPSQDSGAKMVVIKLLNHHHRDIFSVLCEDLINCISSIDKENEIVKILFNRLRQWKSIFERLLLNGLSIQSQKGLYGELFLLRKLLKIDKNNLDSWVGCTGEIRDFQRFNWAIEVKTSHNDHYRQVYVSSENQLDTSSIDCLFLFHLSINDSKKSGESLNQIVESLRELLSDEYILYNRFNNKLLDAGYFDVNSSDYEEKKYIIKQERFYKIEGDFPRIEESDLRNGVGDVKYSIFLSQCSEYIRTEEEVFKKLQFI